MLTHSGMLNCSENIIFKSKLVITFLNKPTFQGI